MKCALVIDNTLPIGLIANTAAVLALSLGQQAQDIIGPDITDGSGNIHPGITRLPVPTLGASSEFLSALRNRLFAEKYIDVIVIAFSGTAQICKTYAEYGERLACVSSDQLTYLGLGLYGPKKIINQLTGSLPLLR